MRDEDLIDTEQDLDRAAVADYLRTVADNLSAGQPVNLSSGNQSVTLDPPQTTTFEVEAEREGEEVSLEFSIEWNESEATGHDQSSLDIN